ncbi:hypothetical protein [Vibrio phage phiKT1028]|nr:hypothetical protein [Vibrio phage phiKT1028]
MIFNKLLYPRTVESFIDKLGGQLDHLARNNKTAYYEHLFNIVNEEYTRWVNYRVTPRIGKTNEVRFINVSIPLNNRSRELIFFRLPIPVGTRLDKNTSRVLGDYCRGLHEAAIINPKKNTPLVLDVSESPVNASELISPARFYSNASFALLRRNGAVQRTVDPSRLWGVATPNFRRYK